MSYYYLHPFKPRYFFPERFKDHQVFLSFFQPYSLIGKVSWFLFQNFKPYRLWVKQTNIESFIPEKEIRKIIGDEPLIAFNTGTPGPEQKITALGWEDEEYFFIKYAQTPLAIKNVTNEHSILHQLSGLSFVPKIQDFYRDQNQALIKTEVFRGTRLGNIPLNQTILNCLYKLTDLSTDSNSSSSIKMSFGHGDFCPWNMMEKDGQILLFDWEMGGTYPLGYDMLTYIFQTQFLLDPKKSIPSILSENNEEIIHYFSHYDIGNWKDYLIAFCQLKIDIEKNKGPKGMHQKYKNLLNYAEKV